MSVMKIKDKNGNWIPIHTIKGEKGDKGEDGKDYALTLADKTEIADIVLAIMPDGDEVSY